MIYEILNDTLNTTVTCRDTYWQYFKYIIDIYMKMGNLKLQTLCWLVSHTWLDKHFWGCLVSVCMCMRGWAVVYLDATAADLFMSSWCHSHWNQFHEARQRSHNNLRDIFTITITVFFFFFIVRNIDKRFVSRWRPLGSWLWAFY